MTHGFEGPTLESPNVPFDETVELPVTAEQLLELEHAMETAQPPMPFDGSDRNNSSPGVTETVPEPPSAFVNAVIRRSARIDRLCNLTLTVAAVGIAAAVAGRALDRLPTAPVRTSLAAVVAAPAPAMPAELQAAQMVRVTNPFDATEVFEFPAATTKTDAREAVAELLLQRARDRRAQGLLIVHARGRHSL
jgi:hypothetical protein